jgi:protein TonB
MTIDKQGRGERDSPRRNEVGLLTAFTLVLWVSCLAVGGTGLLVQHFESHKPSTRPATPMEVLNVEINNDPPPPPDTGPPILADESPPTLEPDASPPPPPLPVVAAPSPAIAFELPIEGPTRVVEATKAIPVRPVEQPAAPVQTPAVVPVQRLILGQGEGRQPPPEYPREALLAHEQGNVTVLIDVGESGQVESVEISTPCRWPILNQAALRIVRDKWRFASGPVRRFQCEFQFQIVEQ